MGKNMIVCYTSSNAQATIFGLKRVRHDSNLKRIGNSLRDAHERYGGITELIAVVWRGVQAPQLLELMPPTYKPRPRRGIIGIGDRSVLQWFRENFDDQAPPEPPPPPAEALEALARAVGHPIQLPPATYSVEQAALQVAAAFSEGIRIVGGPTVSLPVQVMAISGGETRSLGVTATADLENFEQITVERERVRIPRANPPVIRRDPIPRSAVQLVS